ncbi:SDR family NAD(P)-dependent oxidoreductase [Corynebacterium sp.]|uniref:SDR family NAD(P)-dependent oxidoreductase n=1 Tax=Corynebacterium sp. TaxID=1720 RepID=UPI0028AAEFE8|nr:SDR family NAD(P)-dependent oxidoreductase [Corynebacterium sp.]
MTQATNDQTWFITGAGSGLGRALSKKVLARGGRVVAAVRAPDDSAVLELTTGADRVHVVKVDVTNDDEVRAGVADAVARFGDLDVVVNCAGRGSFGSIEETPASEVRGLFDVNVFGSLNVIRAALPVLRNQRHGHFVQISSLAGIAPPAAGLGVYAASKFAVEGLGEVLLKEVSHLGIGVTIVEPGDFRTGFGSAMHVTTPAVADYADSVGRAAEGFASMDPMKSGAPDKAAAAIIDAVTSSQPPLRLALGDDAIESIHTKLTDQLAEGQAWEATGRAMR